MARAIASIFAGGFASMIATALLAANQGAWMVSVMLIVIALITTLTLFSIRRDVDGRRAVASPANPPALQH